MPTNYTIRVLFHMDRSKRNASPWKKIEAKAEEILSAGGRIRKLSGERWRVSSQTVTGKSYVVSFGMNGSACECGYSRRRKGARCKHIAAVEMHIMSQRVRRIPGRDRSGRGGDQVPNRDPCGRFISI